MADAYDLLILTDATASMGHYLHSLNESLPEIIRLSSLTGCFQRIGVLAYRDYFRGHLTEWSGWHGEGCLLSQGDLLDFTKQLTPEHGGDWPEAAKTGLAHAYHVMRSDAKTLILLYADAPPHTPATGGKYHESEQKHLRTEAYGGNGNKFLDWISAARTLRDGDKRACVISIIQSRLADTLSLHLFLSQVTGGVCMRIPDEAQSEYISTLTINVLLTWMGVEKSGATEASERKVAAVSMYRDASAIDDIDSEQHDLSKTYFVKIDDPEHCDLVKNNLASTPLTLGNMKDLIRCRRVHDPDHQIMNFSQRYAADSSYRALVVRQLAEIIQSNVLSMTANPVFGSLWRTVCKDRQNEARDSLIEIFGVHVDRIVFPDKKAKMKAWLAESYDYAGEILDLIGSVPKDQQYPCAFLDPTAEFTEVDADGNRSNSLATFTREELLEFGRSCDYRVLSRLGRALTCLTYVSSEANMPAHIMDVAEADVPRIPLALATRKYDHKFWKVLLHTILPGTMLASRPAALLAALSLRMGIKPLQDVADRELVAYGRWNNPDIPEVWNTNCLNLLLEADGNYRARHGEDDLDEHNVLSHEDRRLFRTLVDYKMLEMNLSTTLIAKVGWQPEKSKVPFGSLVVCNTCKFPRSVTAMSRGGVCGLCDEDTEYESYEIRDAYIKSNVTTKDKKNTPATWVECSMTYCRAQYVVYNAEKLRVRPKCFYCRQDSTIPKNHPQRDSLTIAPCVDCSKCLNRVIWPVEYRPEGFSEGEFRCSACDDGRLTTIIDVETSAKQLIEVEHNGIDWLLRNVQGKIAVPFSGRSLFHVISTAGTQDFADQVEVLPKSHDEEEDKSASKLTIRGKKVQNADAVVATLRSWVDSRRVESGTCSLCFDDFKKSDLRPACGRGGCGQRICTRCFEGWYGMNSPGRIINVAALRCPSCRRDPTAHVLPNTLRSIGDLRTAMDDPRWIYAWCRGCSRACRFVERMCGNGAPNEIEEWSCDDCRGQGGIPFLKYKDQDKRVKILRCPGCGIPTEKIEGCNHVECPQCQTSWCFFCGKAEDHDGIYTHMSVEHGGYYGEEGDLGEDDFDDITGFVIRD